jgi:hypothetical protein
VTDTGVASAADAAPAALGFFHDHPIGRVALSIVLLALVLTVVGWNLPGGAPRDDAHDLTRPVVYALGLDQSWAVFSPNPSTTSVFVHGEVTFADGTTMRFDFPDDGPWLGAYREYRWRKYERRLRLDRQRRLWSPAATWIARQVASEDRPVTEVVLVRRFSTTPDPGSGDPRVWESFAFHTERFDPAVTG